MSEHYSEIVAAMLEKISGLKSTPDGAHNFRLDGKGEERKSSDHIKITAKTDKPGIDIRIADGTVNEKAFIPVVLTKSGLEDLVYNDFFIGENCDVTIIAGCGIHNCGCEDSKHNGIHTFYVGKNSKVSYVEVHYGAGNGTGGRILNPQTIVYLQEGATVVMDTSQIGGVDSTKRYTKVVAEGDNSEVMLTEKLMTHGDQTANSDVDIILNGHDTKARVISPQRGKGELPAGVPSQCGGQRPLLRPCPVRLHHHGQWPGSVHPGHHLQPCGRGPDPRGGHRQDRRRPAPQAHDAGLHRRGGGRAHPARLPEIKF